MSAVLKAGMSLEAMQLRTESTAFALDIQLASQPEVLLELEQRLRRLVQGLSVEPALPYIGKIREELFSNTHATVLKITVLASQTRRRGRRFLANSIGSRTTPRTASRTPSELSQPPSPLLPQRSLSLSRISARVSPHREARVIVLQTGRASRRSRRLGRTTRCH